MAREKNVQPPADDQTPPAGQGTTPPADDTQDTPEAGTTPRRTLQYSTPEELADGRIRLRASDGQGNSLTVTAEDTSRAQASLRAGFNALHGED